MKLTKLSITPNEAAQLISRAFVGTRFNIGEVRLGRSCVSLHEIRLTSKKLYCGNHASACEGPDAKSKKLDYLEGVDWVEWNDRLNDALDGAGVSANVVSGVCVLRIGKARRTRYWRKGSATAADRLTWAKDGDAEDYEDFTLRSAPASTFPQGTPGVYEKIGYDVVG